MAVKKNTFDSFDEWFPSHSCPLRRRCNKKYLLFQTDQPYKVVPPPVTAEGFINSSNYRYIMISISISIFYILYLYLYPYPYPYPYLYLYLSLCLYLYLYLYLYL